MSEEKKVVNAVVKHEKLEDIIAYLRSIPITNPISVICAPIVHALADRIEAAWKLQMSQSWHHREMTELVARHEKEIDELKKIIGNAAAMREALEILTRFEESDIRQLEYLAKRAIDDDIYGGGILQALCGAMRDGKAALAKPSRNCDVGTAEEQLKRFMNYCNSKVCNRRHCACGYEALFRHRCAIRWAQMPYAAEEGDRDA